MGLGANRKMASRISSIVVSVWKDDGAAIGQTNLPSMGMATDRKIKSIPLKMGNSLG